MASTNYEQLLFSLREFKDAVIETYETNNDLCLALCDFEIFAKAESLKADLNTICPEDIEKRFLELMDSASLGEISDILDFENGISEICEMIEKIQQRKVAQICDGVYASEANHLSVHATWKSTDTSNLGISKETTEYKEEIEDNEKDDLDVLFEDDDETNIDELLKDLENALADSNDENHTKEYTYHEFCTPIEKYKSQLSDRVFNVLRRNKIETFEQLSSLSVNQMLALKNMGRSSIPEILYFLNDNGYRPSDCNTETYPNIDEFIKKHFVCKACKNTLDGHDIHTRLCYCFRCGERHNRIFSQKPFEIEVKEPVKETYCGGENGITIYVNIISNSENPFRIKLQDCFLYTNQRQWISSYNYTGYVFTEDYIMPNSTRTFGKIWVNDKWENKDLKINEDYLTLSFSDLKTRKTHYFKFLYSRFNSWELNDYYELD